jgi:mono/diheme cytochrome c family protein
MRPTTSQPSLYRFGIVGAIFLLSAVSLYGCSPGDEDAAPKPATVSEAAGPEISSYELFRTEIIPILENRCSAACHALAADAYDGFMEDPVNAKALYFPVDPRAGKIPADAIEATFQVVVGEARVDYSEPSRFSRLLRAPLAEDLGGEPHRGLDVFYSADDPDYRTMARWLSQEIREHKERHAPLPENIAYFRDHILGVMERNGCFLSSCHGPQVFNDLKLTPPLPGDDIDSDHSIIDRFSREMLLSNHQAMLGKVSRLVNLGGDLTKSRLIVKNLPISRGGIHQRGGNIQFFESLEDQDVKHLLRWMALERQALVQHLSSDGRPIRGQDLGRIEGMVFIRGPRHTPRGYFSFDAFYPGSDIYLLRLNRGETLAEASSVPVNLTKRFHEGPVEIQALDVRYDMRRIVFSMRKGPEQGFRIYELRLNDSLSDVAGKPYPISFAPARLSDGTLIHHVDPLYIPGPQDKEGYELDEVAIAFASNEAGQYAQSDSWGILGEADSGYGNTLIDRHRREPPGLYAGRRLYVVDGPNKGQWRIIEEHAPVNGKGSGARLVLDRPLPQPLDRRTVYVIEKQQGLLRSSFDIWRFVPLADHSAPIAHQAGRASDTEARQQFLKTSRRMTFTYAQERRPTMRTSGEVMFTSVRNIGFQGDRPIFNGAIYRVQAGGFDYHIQGGNRSGYPLYSDSREMGNGLEIRQVHDPRNLWGGGLLVMVDHGFGIHIESDNPLDDIAFSQDSDASGLEFSSPPRYIPAQIPFFKESGEQGVTHTGVSYGGSIRDPYPLLNGSVMSAYTPHPLDHFDDNADPDWDVYVLEFIHSPHTESGEQAGAFRRIRIDAASSAMAEYSPRPLMVRLKEKAHRPLHHQKFGSRSKVIRPQEEYGVLRMPKGLPGEIECYDYPLLQSFLTNFAPIGARDLRIRHGNPNGEITAEERIFKYVRIVMQAPTSKDELLPIHKDSTAGDPFATPVSLGIHTKKVIVAEVPIEEDGSFYVEVPTHVPLMIQGLNADRMAMHGMNRWFYLQPGEKLTFSIPRSIFPLRCAGCHGSLTGDPLQGVGPADLVSASSRVMATWNKGESRRRQPYAKDRTPGEYMVVDFGRDIQPILNRHCVSCHHSDSAPGGLDLRDMATDHYNKAYESLHQLREPASGNYADKRYINEREALSSESPLIDSLRGDSGRDHLRSEGLTEQELLTLIRWIDLGATFKGGEIDG